MLDSVNTSMKKASTRQSPGQPAEVGDLPRVVALVDHADQGEQRAGGKAVVDHLQRAALRRPSR